MALNFNIKSEKSCSDCIFFLDKQDASRWLGSNTNTPVCKKYNKILGAPKIGIERERKMRKVIATNCSGYQQGQTQVQPGNMQKASEHRFQFAFPQIETSIAQKDPDYVTTCKACVFFIEPREVSDTLGITTGACAKKGLFLAQTKLTPIAQECDKKSFGRGNWRIADLMLMPDYATAFAAPKPKPLPGVSHSDPSTYPTDALVSSEDKEGGIRAWRRINNPENEEQYVLLPIYDAGYFTPTQLAKVPQTGDDEHPELFVDYADTMYAMAVLWRELDETPTIWGPPGVGKTELLRHAAWMMGLPFERFSITRSTELDDLAGKMHYTEGQGTHFKYGRLPLAWAQPGVICLDEPNTGPDEVWQFLRPLTDNSKQLVIDMNEGERITRHNDAYMAMAMNPAWDASNIGTNVLADADGSRLMHIYLDLPPSDIEMAIIRKRCELDKFNISDDTLRKMMATARTVRQASQDGTLTFSWGLRNQIKVARAMQWFAPTKAYEIGVGAMLSPEDRTALMDRVRAEFPA